MEDDDFDLYGDLEEFDYKQKFTEQETIAEDLKNQLNNSTKKMTMLEGENKELKKQVNDMSKSFHSLLNTARAEIKRKDGLIVLLRRQKDNIVFRRTNPFRPYQINTDQSTDAIKSLGNTDEFRNLNNEKVCHEDGNDFVNRRRENFNGYSPSCPAYVNDTHDQKIATTHSRVNTKQNLLTTEPTCSYSVQRTISDNKKELTSHDFNEQSPRTEPNHDQLLDIFNDSSLSSDSLPNENLESCLPNVSAKHPWDFKGIHNDNQNEKKQKDKRDPKPSNLKENNDRNHKPDNARTSKEKDNSDRKFDCKSKDFNQDSKRKNNVDSKSDHHSEEEKDCRAKGLHFLKEKDVHDRNRDHDLLRNSKDLSSYDRKYDWKSQDQTIENRNQSSKRRNDSDFKSDRNKRVEKTDGDQDLRGFIEKDVHDRNHDRSHARNLKEKDAYDAKYSRNRNVKITQGRSKNSTIGNDHDPKDKRDSRNSREYMKYGHGHKYDRNPIQNSNATDRRDGDRERMKYDKYNSNEIQSTHSHRTSKQNKWTCQDAVNHQEKSDNKSLKRRQEDTKTSDKKRPRIDDSHNMADRSHNKKKTERIKETGIEASASRRKNSSSECKKNTKSKREESVENVGKKSKGTDSTSDETVRDMTRLSVNYLNDVKERLQKRLYGQLSDDQITVSKLENKKENVKKSKKDSVTPKQSKKSLFNESISDVSNDSLNFDHEMSPFEFGSETEDVPKKRTDLSDGEIEDDDDTCSKDLHPLKTTCKSRSKSKGKELIKISSREIKSRRNETVNRIIDENVNSRDSTDRTNEKCKMRTVEEDSTVQGMVAALHDESKDREIDIRKNEIQVTEAELLQLLSDKTTPPSSSVRSSAPLRPHTPEGPSTVVMSRPTTARSPTSVQPSASERPPIAIRSTTPTRLPTPALSPTPAWPYTPTWSSTPVRPSTTERTSSSKRHLTPATSTAAKSCSPIQIPTLSRSPTSAQSPTPARPSTAVSSPPSSPFPTLVLPATSARPPTPVQPLTEQSQFETPKKDVAKPEDKSEHSFSNELNFGQKTPLLVEVNKNKTAAKKIKRAPSNRINKLNNSSPNDLKAISLYEAYLANPISSLTINGSTGILETILSDSPKTSTKKQRKSPVYGNKKMVGHKIEGFEPIRSSEKSNLETSRELKHELFKDILGPFNNIIAMTNVDRDVTNSLNESQSSICGNEDEQQAVKAKVDSENIHHPIKRNQHHSLHKSPPKSTIESQALEIDPNYSVDIFGSQESYHTSETWENDEEKCNTQQNVVCWQKNDDINLNKNDEQIYRDCSKADDYQNPKSTMAQETDRVDLQTNLVDLQSEQINLDDLEFGRITHAETENIYHPTPNNTSLLNSQETGRSNNDHKTMDTVVLGNQLDSDTNPSNLANSRKSGPALVNNSQQDSIIIPECNEKSSEKSKSGELIDNQFPEIHGGALKHVVEILDIKILPECLSFQNIERSLASQQLRDEKNRISPPLEEKSENLFKSQEAIRDEPQEMSCTLPTIRKQTKSGARRKNANQKSATPKSSQNCIINETVKKISSENSSKPSETEYQIKAVINQSTLKSEHEEIKLKESPDGVTGDILEAAIQIAQISDQLNVSNASFQQTSVEQVLPSDKTDPEPEEEPSSLVSFSAPDTTIGSNSSLNNSNTEKRNISIASSDYLIETVSQNVVNVFITRKKIKKKRK